LRTPGQEGYGHLLFGMLGLNVGLQLFTAVANNVHAPEKRLVAKECLIVLSCCKPGVAASRAAMREERDYTVVDANMELAVTKVIELITEAIPCVPPEPYIYQVGPSTDTPLRSHAEAPFFSGQPTWRR
jgi:hypothetical protein